MTDVRLCNLHGGTEDADPAWTDCDRCEEEWEKRERFEEARERAREERQEKLQRAWLATGGVCSARPLSFRMSGDSKCKQVLEIIDQLCDCQACEDCGSPHNTGREEFADAECQCLAGDRDGYW